MSNSDQRSAMAQDEIRNRQGSISPGTIRSPRSKVCGSTTDHKTHDSYQASRCAWKRIWSVREEAWANTYAKRQSSYPEITTGDRPTATVAKTSKEKPRGD